MGLKQDAWEAILATYDLEFQDRVSGALTAAEIRAATDGTEPRLVCSMDHRAAVPDVLADGGRFVVPVENGVYRLVDGQGYADLPAVDGSPEPWEHGLGFDLATREGAGEDPRLLYAYNTGLLSEFTGLSSLYQTSVGRRYSTRFEYRVGPSRSITVDGVQFQVDGLFEGDDEVVVVEAKVGTRDDFLVRQLYYPYRHYRAETDKTVRTVFFVYDDERDVYRFREFRFEDPSDYASIELVRAAEYEIVETDPEVDAFRGVDRRPELGWTVPQANAVWRLQEIPFLVARGVRDSDALQAHYGFERRQANYYAKAAAENLRLIDRTGSAYTLTDLGARYVDLRPDRRHELVARQMLTAPVMNAVFETLVDRYVDTLAGGDASVSRDEIADRIAANTDLSGTTPGRRASTVVSWFEWIARTVGVVWVEEDEIGLAV